jgi:large repetitive protein
LFDFAADGGGSGVAPYFPAAAWSLAVNSFSPSSGQPGNVITINGSGFTAATEVVFNNNQPTLADFTNVSDSQLLVVVPVGATSGALEVFAGGTGVSSSSNFLVAPVISAFFPQSGASPTVVSIEGANFISGGTTVIFPGVSTKISATYIASTEVSVTVPAGAGNGPITVITSAGTNVSTNDFLASDLPSIASFSPTIGSNGTTVEIFGGNFFSGATVKFGSVTAGSVSVVSTTEITATVPSGAVTGPIMVTTSDGSATTTSNFLTGTGPIITGFSPVMGAVNSSVSISGLNLSAVTSVSFNGIREYLAGYSGDTNLQVDLTNNPGTGPIKVTTATASFTTSTNFTNTSAPFVTDFNPVAGPEGTMVTIEGINFTGTPTVKFGSATASSTLIGEGTQISATVPNIAAGVYAIEVTTSAGSFITSSNFLLTGAGPVIASFTPSNGVRGTTVTLTGANFGSVTSVKFNGVDASYQSGTSINQMTATVPADAASGLITVANASGTGTSPSLFYLQPWITSLSTNGGIVNSTLTMTGRSLTNTSALQINGVNYNFVASASQIVATIPSNATSGQIVITAPGGVFINPGTFAILPKIYEFSPDLGPAGTVVTISGTSLFDVTSVEFNGVPAPVSSAMTNEVQVVVPANATSGPLTVVTPYGNDTSTNSFAATKSSLVLLTKTANPVVAGPGTNITYILLVTNEGPSIITSAVVSDTMPIGFSVVSVTPSAGTWINTNGTLTWNIGVLTNSNSVSLDIVGTTPDATVLTNSAVLAFAEGNLAPYDDYASVINFFVYDSQRTLSVRTQANPQEVVVTWPLSPVNFLLQINTNANLNAGWTYPTNAVFITNLLNTFTDTLSAPQTFFRLAPP